MLRSGSWRLIALCLAMSAPAAAQVLWDVPKPGDAKFKPDNPNLRIHADAWPRLDPGAVLCKTEADLLRLAAARRGEQVEPPNCQLIRMPTPVTIEKRAGLGRTQVAITEQQGLDGWTDAWLPERAPVIGGKAVTIK